MQRRPINDIFAHEDMLPTLAAAVGEPNVKEELLKGKKVGNDDGSLVGLRYNQYKIVFQEQTHHGVEVWRQGFNTLRAPKLFNLRSDPFETADEGGNNK